jgi:outer membrane protein
MRVFVVALALAASLSAAPAFAQAPAPAPQTQEPAAPAPAAPAAQPAAPTPRFQEGMKYAYVQLQVIVQFSAQGKTFNSRVQALNDQKVKEIQDRTKAMQAAQQKLDQGGSLLNDQARAQLQRDIERQQLDIQRATEDAQQEINALTQQLQVEFQRLLDPVIEQVAKQKQVHFVFNATESGLIWADPSMDLTAEVIQALDAAAKPAAPAGK